MKIKKRILSLALAGTMVIGLMPGMNMTALAAEGDTSYTLTIPSTLSVANSGWNATDGISATGTLASGKKLTVTASSANSWALKSGDNSVGYTLTTAEDGSQTTSWEFTTLDGTAKPMGIIVEDYTDKPAGTYQDTVTFTASVKSAVSALAGIKENGAIIELKWNWTDSNAMLVEFRNDNGTMTRTKVTRNGNNASSYTFDGSIGAQLDDNRLIISGSGATGIFDFDIAEGTYTVKSSYNKSVTSIKLNGTDITDQLTKQE